MKYILIIVAWLCSATLALADYKSEYKLYNEAFAAGDIARAAQHGEAAWRAAEDELGDHAITAILAYNYGRLMAAYAPAKALEAYERALAITQMGIGSLDAQELQIRTGNMRLTLDIKNKEVAESLEALLSAAEQRSDPPTEALSLGWKTVAIHKSQRNKIDDANDAADKAIIHARALDPRDPRLLAETLILGATLRLARPYRSEDDIFDMVLLLDESFPLFAPQRSIHQFDTLLARAMQLRATAGALARSDELRPFVGRGSGSRLQTGENLRQAYDRAVAENDIYSQVTWADGTPGYCTRTLVWADRPDPSYPRKAIQNSYIGAVIVGYDLSETGVEKAVVLADADRAGFGDAVVKAMEKWTLGQTVPPDCRKNHLVYFTFIIKQT